MYVTAHVYMYKFINDTSSRGVTSFLGRAKRLDCYVKVLSHHDSHGTYIIAVSQALNFFQSRVFRKQHT